MAPHLVCKYLKDKGMQCSLNFGDVCHIYFRDMGYFSKQLKGYWILGPPVPGPR